MPRDTQDSDQVFPDFAYGTLTLSGPPFQCGSAIPSNPSVGPPTPRQLAPTRFGLLRFRSPLLTEFSLFLRVLRCFTSPSSPLRSYLFTTRCPGIPQGGFPHSDICGSMPYHNSPQLFAVVHVLPRPLAPRHPPYALRSLTCCAQSSRLTTTAPSHSYSSSSLSYLVLNVPGLRLLTTCCHLRTDDRNTCPQPPAAHQGLANPLPAPPASQPAQPPAHNRHTAVGLRGLEPRTPALSAQCSNRLSYRPSSTLLPTPCNRGTLTPEKW